MKLIIFLLSIILSINTFAQQKTTIECIYIKKYNKEEIMHRFLNEQKKINKESYESMIDYSTETYCFTLTIDSLIKIQSSADIVNYVTIKGYKNLEYFVFPPFNDYIKRTYRIDNKNDFFSENTNYYYVDSDTTHLYQIYHIRGQAERVIVNNDRTDKEQYFNIAINWQIPPITINRTIPAFYVYLFNEIYSLSSDVQLSGFKIWKYAE